MNNSLNGNGKFALLWLDWIPQSENQIRSQHWTKSRQHAAKGKVAFKFALLSSPAAGDFWTMTTASLGTSAYATKSPQASELTTETQESGGATDRCSQALPKEP